MKIGILTQPLRENYGGLLQAYALQLALKKMGHDVLTIDKHPSETSIVIKILSILGRLALSLLTFKPRIIRVWPTSKENMLITKNTYRFIKENLNTTGKIYTQKELLSLNTYGFGAYIVGSDQVWRPEYTTHVTNYFFDFVNNKLDVKRIAYAASFGVDKWVFTDLQTSQCALLVKQFNAISVREDSAISLCNKYLGVDAVHVLDPTLLLAKEEYIVLVVNDNIPKSKGNLMTYVLDKSSDKNEIIQYISKELDLTPFSVLPDSTFAEVGCKNISACIYPPVTEWIRGFMDAEFIVTDSFHGTVFSIIFNKPFLAIGNNERGMTRFLSLLKMFGLEDRLIFSKNELSKEKIIAKMDFTMVNKIWQNEKNNSLRFLTVALNNQNKV